MEMVFFENFLLFVNSLLEIRNYFQQIRYICITTVLIKIQTENKNLKEEIIKVKNYLETKKKH